MKPLLERFRTKVLEIAYRSDVTVHQLKLGRGGISPGAKWQAILPPDMFAFFAEGNGASFHYSFVGESEWHGVHIYMLYSDGKRTINTETSKNGITRGPAKDYGPHFFQPNEIDPEAPVLFFLGAEDAWGVLMIGAGETATFRQWDNDGFTQAMPGTYTEIIERLISRGFAHTWEYDKHSDTDAVVARLATMVPLRKCFELRVENRLELSGDDYRRASCRTWSQERTQSVVRALGLIKELKGKSQDEVAERVAAACRSLDAMDPKAVGTIMKKLGADVTPENSATAQFAQRFAIGHDNVVEATLALEYVAGPFVLHPADDSTLIRVLHDIEGLQVTKNFPGSGDVLRDLPRERWNNYSPFFHCDWDGKFHGDSNKVATFRVTMTTEQAAGLDAGRVFETATAPSLACALAPKPDCTATPPEGS